MTWSPRTNDLIPRQALGQNDSSEKKLCAIIPCFEQADFVANAIGSVLRQLGDRDGAVIVVDDGSRDGTGGLLAQMAVDEPRLTLIRQPHQGAAAARNAGLAALPDDCELVTFLDSDDVMCLGRIAADVPLFADDPALDFTFGRIRMVDALDYVSGQPTRTARQVEFSGPHLGAALFRRSFVDRVGQFDTGFIQGEDVDYLLRTFEASPKFLQTDTLCVNFLRHDRNLLNNSSEARRGFLHALQKSVARRRADPSIVVHRPAFPMRALTEASFDASPQRMALSASPTTKSGTLKRGIFAAPGT